MHKWHDQDASIRTQTSYISKHVHIRYVHLVQVPACVQYVVACIYYMSEGITAKYKLCQQPLTKHHVLQASQMPIPS